MIIRNIGNFQYWYDKHYKCWFAATYDADGNQLSAAIDAYTKDEIIKYISIELNTI